MISRQALQEFQDIWLEEHHTPISDQEAMEKATALLTLFDAVYKPVHKDWVVPSDEQKGIAIKHAKEIKQKS